MEIGCDIQLTLRLLEQSRADTAAVFLLQYKALGIIVILGKHLQIVASRAKVFVSFPAHVEDIGDGRFSARLRRLSGTQREAYRRAQLRIQPSHRGNRPLECCVHLVEGGVLGGEDHRSTGGDVPIPT